MLEPIQQKTWPSADRRAWSIGLSLFFLTAVFAAIAWWNGSEWTFQTTLEYVPKELTIKAYDIASDLMEFSMGLPNFAFGEYFVVQNILPPEWIYFPALVVFLLALSLLAAGVSYFEDTPLYLALAGFGAGVTLFGAEALGHLEGLGQWASALGVLLVAGPVYVLSTWLGHWNLARRWWVLLIWYGGTASLGIFQDFGVSDQALVVAHLWYPLLIGALLFIVLNSTDVLQGMLTLLTREENNTQSWMHFTVFSFLYLSNFILIYLRNTGQFVLDIFYFNPIFLQVLTMAVGFWMIEKKTELTRSENQPDTGLWAIYAALGILCCLCIGLSYGLANDLMWEVLEDAITLIHFCMGMSFFLYVLINFFQLMGMGLRVHLVIFKPRYMPVAGIPVFGLGAVVLFLINEGYFPYYQALSAKEVLLADHYRMAGDRFLAENHLMAALSLEHRNQRTNLSLTGLFYETGNIEKGRQFAEVSLEKRPCPEAYLAMAQVYRRKGNTLEEILQLQEGLRKFPKDGRLLNNLGMAFNETVFSDSALIYFSRAAETHTGAEAGKSNLGFYYLVHKLKKDGLPQKSPESDASGDWARMNNNMVFANVAGEVSASLGDVQRKFEDIPEELQPFVLFHAYINKAITKDSSDAAAFKKLENDSLVKYYSHALDLGKALLHYRTGQTYRGMDEMLHLFHRGTDRKMEMALLLGQVYFDQGAYESAALFFRQAAEMGMPKAMY